MQELINAGSEQNLKNRFSQIFFNGNTDFERDKIDLIANNITFESKYNKDKAASEKYSVPEMYAQLIATHKKHNIPFKKYIGVFDENGVSFMESDIVEKRIETVHDIEWEKITPSGIKKNKTLSEKIIQDIIPNRYEYYEFNNNIEKIKNVLELVNLNKYIKIREEITEEELRKVIVNINEKFHKIKTLKDTDRSLFFSAIMIALHESYPLSIIETQQFIVKEEKAKIEAFGTERKKQEIGIEKNAVAIISDSILKTISKLIKAKINNTSKEKWENQFSFIKNLDLDLNEYIDMIKLINSKIYRSFKSGQKQDILGKAYKIFLSKAGKVDNKNIILTPDHIKHLMVELACLNKDDVVLDTCMGTGGFLMEAMEKMESLSDVDDKKKEEIHSKQLIGSEIEPKLFVLACSNMFLHGDGRSQLYDKDTINDDITFGENGFFDYIKSLKPTKCIINPPYEGSNCFLFTKQALDFLENNGKLIVIIKENTFQKINKDAEDLLKNNTLDFYIKMPANLFSEQNRSVSTAIFGWTKGTPHPHNKYVKFYNLSDDGFEVIPHNGRLDTKNLWNGKENEILEYVLYNKEIDDKNIAYSERIFNDDGKLLPIYHHFIEKTEPPCIEDFEEAIFDYFLYEQDLLGGGDVSK